MAPSQNVDKCAISITHVDTNMMVVTHIKNQLKIWRRIGKVCITDFQQFSKLLTLNFGKNKWRRMKIKLDL